MVLVRFTNNFTAAKSAVVVPLESKNALFLFPGKALIVIGIPGIPEIPPKLLRGFSQFVTLSSLFPVHRL